MIYLKLFWSFFQIGLFSIGGGYAILPMINYHAVELNGWINLTVFTDIITIAEMTPGPIALNASTFVGIQVGGILGAIVATAGCVAPSCIIVSIFAHIYFKYKNLSVIQGIIGGLRPAVVSLIASAGLTVIILALWGEQGVSLNITSIDFIALGLFAAALFILGKFKPNPIFIILGSGAVGGILYLII